MLKGLIGKKIGMTQIFDEQGVAYPVTLIEAGPCYVTQVRKPEKEGYSAVQLGFGEVHPKRLTGGQLGHLKANKIPPLRFLREFRAKIAGSEGRRQGDRGRFRRRRACGCGRREQGQGFCRRRQALSFPWHGRHARHLRSRACSRFELLGYHPRPCLPGSRRAGHMGMERVTAQNLKVVLVDAERNLLGVHGAVPGAKGGLVVVNEARKQ